MALLFTQWLCGERADARSPATSLDAEESLESSRKGQPGASIWIQHCVGQSNKTWQSATAALVTGRSPILLPLNRCSTRQKQYRRYTGEQRRADKCTNLLGGSWGEVHTIISLCHNSLFLQLCTSKLPRQDLRAVSPVTALAPNPPFTPPDDGLPSAIHKFVTSLLVYSNEWYLSIKRHKMIEASP